MQWSLEFTVSHLQERSSQSFEAFMICVPKIILLQIFNPLFLYMAYNKIFQKMWHSSQIIMTLIKVLTPVFKSERSKISFRCKTPNYFPSVSISACWQSFPNFHKTFFLTGIISRLSSNYITHCPFRYKSVGVIFNDAFFETQILFNTK